MPHLPGASELIISFLTSRYLFSVLYCTLLAQAQSESERDDIKKTMRADTELSIYLSMLEETDKDDLVAEEQARRQAARQSRIQHDLEGMELDMDEEMEVSRGHGVREVKGQGGRGSGRRGLSWLRGDGVKSSERRM